MPVVIDTRKTCCGCGRAPVRQEGQRYCHACHAEAQKKYRINQSELTGQAAKQLVQRHMERRGRA